MPTSTMSRSFQCPGPANACRCRSAARCPRIVEDADWLMFSSGATRQLENFDDAETAEMKLGVLKA